MNEEAHKFILEHFCEQRSLSPKAIPAGLTDMICAVTAPYFLMIECLDELDSDPTQGLLIKLVSRSYEAAAGSLALAAIGHLREAETLSRSVYESSVTTTYIVQENPAKRFAQFFQYYVRQEREQNRKWSNDVEAEPPTVRKDHEKRISQKNEAMDAYEKFIDLFVEHCGIDLETAKNWPGLIDRLTALGRRIDYRTVYAAMCSQSHHDAEDVLNHFFANSVVGADDIAERMEREANIFSIFMVLFGLQSFVEAMLAVCRHLKFPTVVAEGTNSLKRITDELHVIAPHLDTGEFPENWVKKGT
ncbi:DUF5677 domain-containing protein [Sphingorhabdus sp. YGSMI21]|uniref:DUF5677 domain-containing protein n=1 Tax=Sphingorhabdus sp. YGSMI21 TaxID=2077182 RepID=UPI000C1F1B6F|nr:DUF5677 domain-containing protein [Sphingorhabdus sp. YGSMI21]ATW02367.1 hypothetical protein CHN51_01620 [Sphingorhabdus sp. YGSMI21]